MRVKDFITSKHGDKIDLLLWEIFQKEYTIGVRWNPFQEEAHAFEIVRELAVAGWYLTLNGLAAYDGKVRNSSKIRYMAAFHHHGGLKYGFGVHSSDELGESICVAALLALGALEDKALENIKKEFCEKEGTNG